jgi:hypothetical protein
MEIAPFPELRNRLKPLMKQLVRQGISPFISRPRLIGRRRGQRHPRRPSALQTTIGLMSILPSSR